jgi:chromosome segregation ATPase
VEDLVTLAPLLLVIVGIPGALIAVLTWQRRQPAPKDQSYYETLIDTAWQSADRIQAELDREIGRRQQLESELEKDRDRSALRIQTLRNQLEECRRNVTRLEHDLHAKQDEIGALKRAMQRWLGGEGGEQPA